jgi:hypothetical protein
MELNRAAAAEIKDRSIPGVGLPASANDADLVWLDGFAGLQFLDLGHMTGPTGSGIEKDKPGGQRSGATDGGCAGRDAR